MIQSSVCSVMSDSETNWTVTHEPLCPWEFPAKTLEWIAIFSSGILPTQKIKPLSFVSPALQAYSLPTAPLRKPNFMIG